MRVAVRDCVGVPLAVIGGGLLVATVALGAVALVRVARQSVGIKDFAHKIYTLQGLDTLTRNVGYAKYGALLGAVATLGVSLVIIDPPGRRLWLWG